MSEDYGYDLPEELIANTPAEPRDASRLFIYDTNNDRVVLDRFANITNYIPKESILVLNDTKVVPARLELLKKTGGKVVILFLVNEWDKGLVIKGLPDRKINPEEILSLSNGTKLVEVISNDREEFIFRLKITPEEFESVCGIHGHTPLPPYIHTDMNEKDIRNRYQTTFATNPASVAAPTASLHFTPTVFDSLNKKGIEYTKITLHVGRGTFSPVTETQISSGHLHGEPVEVSKDASLFISEAKKSKKKIIAAGTTVVRALESSAKFILEEKEFRSDTNIFIQPPYGFKIVDGLITNFHLPGTSLLMLIDALLKSKNAKRSWKELYQMAIDEKFRFYSFGDAMLII